MNIIIKSTNFDLTPSIREQVEEKLGAVKKFIPDNTEPVELRVEVGLTSKHHTKGEIYRAEANLRIHDDILRSESTKEDLLSAIIEARQEMERLITRYKKKKTDVSRKDQRTIKAPE